MNKIFYIMGKSASGKDTIYKKLLEREPWLNKVILYTTRPIREGEENGVEYHFTTDEKFREYKSLGKVIEARTYETMEGPWTYFTVDDGQFDLRHSWYLMIGTLESYEKMQHYFGDSVMESVFISVEDGVRLQRALNREQLQKTPKYKELCRRFLADEEDFRPENLKRCKIFREFKNDNLEQCLEEIQKHLNKFR